MTYIYDAQKIHDFIKDTCGQPREVIRHKDLFSGIAKTVNGRIVAGFTLKGIGGRVFEFSGAAASPMALRKDDYLVMLRYLAHGADAVIAFTSHENVRARLFLNKIGFLVCGNVRNYWGDGETALMFQLDIAKTRKTVDNHKIHAAAASLSCFSNKETDYGRKRTISPPGT